MAAGFELRSLLHQPQAETAKDTGNKILLHATSLDSISCWNGTMSAIFSLRARILATLSVMFSLVVTGAGCMVWYAYQSDAFLGVVVGKEMVLYNAALEMELAIANQKGFLTYYFIDGEAKWLDSLGQYRRVFDQCLERALTFDLTLPQRRMLMQI
jgi:hypothetical protein